MKTEKDVVKTAIWAYIEGYKDAAETLMKTAEQITEEELQHMFDHMEKEMKEQEGMTEQ
jgi:hypothetical protein